jgi:hypothetical protein
VRNVHLGSMAALFFVVALILATDAIQNRDRSMVEDVPFTTEGEEADPVGTITIGTEEQPIFAGAPVTVVCDSNGMSVELPPGTNSVVVHCDGEPIGPHTIRARTTIEENEE